LTIITLCSGISKQNATSFCNSYTNVSTSGEILVKISSVTSEFKRAIFENVPQFGCNLTIVIHLARWRSESD